MDNNYDDLNTIVIKDQGLTTDNIYAHTLAVGFKLNQNEGQKSIFELDEIIQNDNGECIQKAFQEYRAFLAGNTISTGQSLDAKDNTLNLPAPKYKISTVQVSIELCLKNVTKEAE